MRPGPFAEHFVALQAGLVGLAEGIACSSHTDVLHQAQVAHLMADQRVGEDVGRLLIIGFDAAGKQENKLQILGWCVEPAAVTAAALECAFYRLIDCASW